MKAWKKSLLALLTVLLLTSLCGCTKGSSAIELDTKNAIEDSVVEQLIDYTNTILSEPLQETSYEDFVMFRSMGQYFVSIPFDTNFEKRWGDFTALHGDIVTAECTEAEAEEGGYVSHIVLTGEDGQMMRLNVTFDDSMRPLSTTLEPYADDGNKTTGEKMAEAGMNTLIGLGVVFGVLILLTAGCRFGVAVAEWCSWRLSWRRSLPLWVSRSCALCQIRRMKW